MNEAEAEAKAGLGAMKPIGDIKVEITEYKCKCNHRRKRTE